MIPTLIFLFCAVFSLNGCKSGIDSRVRAIADLREAARGKNVVMVLLDAAAWEHFGCAGYDRATTPVIDALAAESLVFDTAYTPAASTSHAVFSLLTSSYPFTSERAGLEEGIVGAPFKVTDETKLMAELLAPHFAHRSGISGNPWFGPKFDLDRGFTHFHEAYDNAAVADSTKPSAGRVLDCFRTDLAGWTDEPSFVYAHFLEPHAPYAPPAPWDRLFDPVATDSIDTRAEALLDYRLVVPDRERQERTRALYDANLAFVDATVGDMIETLKQSGRWEDTILLLIADHGEAFWQHGVYGHGRHIYEEFMRVPIIVHFPGRPELAGRHIGETVSLVDLLPTFLDLVGDEIPREVRGRSLLPLIAGCTEDFEDRMVYLRNTHSVVPEYGLRIEHYKWVYRVYENRYLLFDLETDPDELHDLVAAGAVPPEIAPYRDEVALWIAAGTGRVDYMAELDEQTKAQLHSIGYF